MSNLQEIEQAVSQLSSSELITFRNWFAEFDAEIWDRQVLHGLRAMPTLHFCYQITMNAITYRFPAIGDENQLSGCMWASADLWELTDGTPESVAEWNKLCNPEELRNRILSGEQVLVAKWNGIIVGFIAFKRNNHLSLLFVRREFSRQGIGRELFNQCTHDFDEVTVNAAEEAVAFYQKVGFVQSGDRFFKYGIWGTPMKWSKHTTELVHR